MAQRNQILYMIFFFYFLEECKKLIADGLEIDGKIYLFSLKAFICDALARAFLKGIVNHNGYYSCERCTIKGQYVQNRMTYLPNVVAAPRNGRDFAEFVYYPDHQKHISPFGQTPNFDCVSQFLFDYMHLVLLGVCKANVKFHIKGPLNLSNFQSPNSSNFY